MKLIQFLPGTNPLICFFGPWESDWLDMSASTERSGWFLAVAFRVFSAEFSSVFSASPAVLCWVVPRAACVTVFRPELTVNRNKNFCTMLKGMEVFLRKTLQYGPWGRVNNLLRFTHMMKCESQIPNNCLQEYTHDPYSELQQLKYNEIVVSHCAHSPSDGFCSLSWAWAHAEGWLMKANSMMVIQLVPLHAHSVSDSCKVSNITVKGTSETLFQIDTMVLVLVSRIITQVKKQSFNCWTQNLSLRDPWQF